MTREKNRKTYGKHRFPVMTILGAAVAAALSVGTGCAGKLPAEETQTEYTETEETTAEMNVAETGTTAEETETSETETERVEDTAPEETETVPSGPIEEKVPEDYEVINEKTMSDERSRVLDVTKLTAVGAEEIQNRILEYAFPESCSYLDGAPLSREAVDRILAGRNLETVQDWDGNHYAVIVSNAAVRSFPTMARITQSTEETAFDYGQESMFLTGEPVAVLHQTDDRSFCFVQGPNYRGWVETAHLGFCTKEEVLTWTDSESCSVVTVPYLTVGSATLRMGTVLPAYETEDGVTIKMPDRNPDGGFTVTEVQMPSAEGLHMGYLTLSEEAVLYEAGLLVGVPYGWGDTNLYMDCSSTMNSIYRCFGIILPRNTSELSYTGAAITDLSGMSAEEKRYAISSMAPGTLLLMKGHVVMYIGETDGQASILHNVTSYSEDGGATVQNAYRCCITPLDVSNAAGVSNLERYSYAISFADWYRK